MGMSGSNESNVIAYDKECQDLDKKEVGKMKADEKTAHLKAVDTASKNLAKAVEALGEDHKASDENAIKELMERLDKAKVLEGTKTMVTTSIAAAAAKANAGKKDDVKKAKK